MSPVIHIKTIPAERDPVRTGSAFVTHDLVYKEIECSCGWWTRIAHEHLVRHQSLELGDRTDSIEGGP